VSFDTSPEVPGHLLITGYVKASINLVGKASPLSLMLMTHLVLAVLNFKCD